VPIVFCEEIDDGGKNGLCWGNVFRCHIGSFPV